MNRIRSNSNNLYSCEMITHVFLLSIFALSSFAEEGIPLKVLYEIVPGFPNTDFCDRDGVTAYWMDTKNGNVRHISAKAILKPGETSRDMCSCFYRYLSQRDWLRGARIKCHDDCDYGILELIGKPDPTYNPNIMDENLDKPLEELRAIFHNTPTATPTGLVCSTDCNVDADSLIHCTLTCPINADPRTTDQICTDITTYYNQNGWSDGASTSCNQINDDIVVEFVGSS